MSKYNYVYGVNTVTECLKAGIYKISVIYLLNINNKRVLKLIRKKNIRYELKSKEELYKMFGTNNHQGVVAIISNWKTEQLPELVNSAKQKYPNPLFIILDQIEDPHNFGAIMRTCDLFNVAGIIILNIRQVQLNPVVAKVSTGAFNYVPVCVVNNLSNAIQYLKKNNFWIYTTTFSEKSVPFDSIKYNTGIVLVLGNEGDGISKRIITESDFEIHIPTDGHIDSLNVSTAAAILIYEISKQLKGA